MKRFLTVVLMALSVAGSSSAQTRGGRQTPSRQTPSRPSQSRPSARPSATPARPTPSPAASTAQPAPASAPDPVAEACACESQRPVPEIMAVVNGVRIARADLSPNVRERVRQLQQEVVEARKRELNLQINSRLLAAEAKKRNTTVTKLLEAEVVAKTAEPTEAETRAFYEQNRARIEQQAGRAVTFEQVRAQAVEHLRYQRQEAAAGSFAERLRAAAQVQMHAREATPPATAADRARVLATVNGEKITSGDIEDALRPLVYEVQEQVYMLRKNDIDTRINDTLLEQEAQRRKVTSAALFETEVRAKVPVITETEARKFYDENKSRINGDFAQIKYQIISFLEEQAAQKAGAQFAQSLRNAASVQTFLTPPAAPVYEIATDDQPSKGGVNAPVTIVEFTDFQCPSCAEAHPVVERLAAEYGDRLRVVVRDFPLEQHAQAMKAAEAAEAAREQGKFWEYVALLYRNQSALEPAQLKQYATQVGLDRARFDAALDSGKFAEAVRRDQLDGHKLRITGTPAFFVNGRRAGGVSYEALKGMIEAALKAAPTTK